MSSSRVRVSLHISNTWGRVEGAEAEGDKKAKNYEGDDSGRNGEVARNSPKKDSSGKVQFKNVI